MAYITGLVNQRWLLQCEYLAAENRILRSRVSGDEVARAPVTDAYWEHVRHKVQAMERQWQQSVPPAATEA